MKFLIAATLVAAVFGDVKKFPKKVWKHAYCEINSAMIDKPCSQVYNLMHDVIDKNQDPASPPGTYKIKENMDQDYIWATRLTAN